MEIWKIKVSDTMKSAESGMLLLLCVMLCPCWCCCRLRDYYSYHSWRSKLILLLLLSGWQCVILLLIDSYLSWKQLETVGCGFVLHRRNEIHKPMYAKLYIDKCAFLYSKLCSVVSSACSRYRTYTLEAHCGGCTHCSKKRYQGFTLPIVFPNSCIATSIFQITHPSSNLQ